MLNNGQHVQGGARGRIFRVRGRRHLFRWVKIKFVRWLFLALILVAVIRLKNPAPPRSQQRHNCSLPKLNPFALQMMTLIDGAIFRSKPTCYKQGTGTFKEAAFHVENGHVLVRDVEFPANVTCCFKNVTRVHDEEVRITGKCTKIDKENRRTAIQSPTEVILVICDSPDSQYYVDAFQLFQEKPDVEERIKTWEEQQKFKVKDDQDHANDRLSVIIIGMDTTSQMQFERAMNLSKSYLDQKLSALRFMGYNKVAANTLPNLLPLLTGMTWNEFHHDCVKRPYFVLGRRLQNCAFIWNTFASQGYRTAFSEDKMRFSIFNLHYTNAFPDEPPTDYYGRSYAIIMEKEKSLGFREYCYGPRLSFQTLMDNVKLMTGVFQPKNRSSFQFVWSTALQHGTLDTHPWGDEPLQELLQYLHTEGHLNHTALFVLGDHGDRNHDYIEQGFIENRQPLAYIALPPWFSHRYPKAYQNMKWNAENSVASPFDMHKTLLDILDLERFDGALGKSYWRENRHYKPKYSEWRNRGQSLFEMNPEGRDCESAGIPWIWCLCLERIPLKNDSFLAVKAAEAVVSHVNSRIWGYNRVCEEIKLEKVLTASVMLLNSVVTLGQNQNALGLSTITLSLRL